MSTQAKLRIVLGEDNCVKLVLPSGIPDSVDSLKLEIQKQCGVEGEFRLQYMDHDFDQFMNLTSTGLKGNRFIYWLMLVFPNECKSPRQPSVCSCTWVCEEYEPLFPHMYLCQCLFCLVFSSWHASTWINLDAPSVSVQPLWCLCVQRCLSVGVCECVCVRFSWSCKSRNWHVGSVGKQQVWDALMAFTDGFRTLPVGGLVLHLLIYSFSTAEETLRQCDCFREPKVPREQLGCFHIQSLLPFSFFPLTSSVPLPFFP